MCIRDRYVFKMNPYNCSSVEIAGFNTYWEPDEATALSNYLQQLDAGTVIVAVAANEARQSLQNALSTLSAMGVEVSDVQVLGTYAFAAQKGFPAKTVLRKVLTQGELPPNGQMKFSVRIAGRLPNLADPFYRFTSHTQIGSGLRCDVTAVCTRKRNLTDSGFAAS